MDLKCLICGKPASNDRRGLCGLHYSRFNAAKKKLPEEERQAFERELIEKKLLLPPKPKGRVVTEDPFAEIANKRLQNRTKTIDEEAAEIIAEGDAQLKKIHTKHNQNADKSNRKRRTN